MPPSSVTLLLPKQRIELFGNIFAPSHLIAQDSDSLYSNFGKIQGVLHDRAS